MSYILHNENAVLVGSSSLEFGTKTNLFVDKKKNLKCFPIEFDSLKEVLNFRDKVAGITMMIKQSTVSLEI